MFWRPVQDTELEACLAIAPAHVGSELVGRERAFAAWRRLLRRPGFQHSVILEGSPAREGPNPILGFGASAFIVPSFSDAELAEPAPGVNGRFIAAFDGKNSPTLDAAQLRRANSEDGLDLVVLAGVYRQGCAREKAFEVLGFMAGAFIELHAGYRVRRVIAEVIGEAELDYYLSNGGVWRCVRRFGDDRALCIMSRDEVLAVPTNAAIPLFLYTEPVLHLRETDQELLLAALKGLTDDELARELNIHVGTVKKRWLEVYHRIAESQPELLTTGRLSDGEKTARGKQKRHHLLAYLREHPEELRPYEFAAPVNG